jgi:hypothetical protein
MVVFGMFIDVHASVRLCLLLVHNLSLSGVSTKQKSPSLQNMKFVRLVPICCYLKGTQSAILNFHV